MNVDLPKNRQTLHISTGSFPKVVRLDMIQSASFTHDSRTSCEIVKNPEKPVPCCYLGNAFFHGDEAKEAWQAYTDYLNSLPYE